ncbi:hypothetical protein F5Y16DRAFT_414510 [Xylariaceae sp. FL0255]|nr:hypothetical protein F5Y16DRAFT_414510 [Xylariaceae sp. FL0255]
MPSDDHKKEESDETENHINHDDEPEETQEEDNTTQDEQEEDNTTPDGQEEDNTTQNGQEEDVVPIRKVQNRQLFNMTEIIQPSPELLGLLADLCQFKIPADTIHKVDTSDRIDVSKVTWPLQQDALLRKALEKAVEESKKKILQEAAKSKQWRAEVVILRKGSLVPFPGEICLIIPLVQSSGPAEKVPAFVSWKES